jgi:peptidoglycan hydrolase-like protein with peptidoglycan-binding domain
VSAPPIEPRTAPELAEATRRALRGSLRPDPYLRFGMQGLYVRWLQRQLEWVGAARPEDPDGVFGTNTRDALRTFQRARGLPVDGVVGPQTWAALQQRDPQGPVPARLVEPKPPPAEGSHGFLVRAVQAQLNWLGETGAEALAVDGVFGPATRAAVEAFQARRGLEVDGIVGPATWSALFESEVPTPVPGEALIRIFARFAEIVSERINGLPERNLLAFLGLVGISLEPPQPARAPLTFHLAPGSVGVARVPARTQVAAVAAEGETDPPIFETERELLATATQLVEVWTRDPAADRVSARTATGPEFEIFAGAVPIDHELYLGDPLLALEQPKTVTVTIAPANPAAPWPYALAWDRWAGDAWAPVPATVSPGDAWTIELANVPAVPASEVGERPGSWLRARLATPLPPPEPVDGRPAPPGMAQQSGLAPDAVGPFGVMEPTDTLTIASEAAFSKPGAQAWLAVELDPVPGPAPSRDLVLAWEYSTGPDAWAELGRSTPSSANVEKTPSAFQDETRALTRNGSISFVAPADWAAPRLLRARIDRGDFGAGPAYRPPVPRRVEVGYRWELPRVDALTLSVEINRSELTPDAAFANVAPLDLSKDFKPFGDAPTFNDAFALESAEAFSKPGATVTFAVTATKGWSGSDRAELTWEAFDEMEGRWVDLKAVDGTNALTADGTVTLTLPAAPAPVAVAGVVGYWVRARITANDYGKPQSYRQADDPTKGFVVVPATLNPPSIAALRIGYDFVSERRQPDSVAHNDFAYAGGPVGTPFVPTADARPTLYLGADGDFGNHPTSLYFGLAETAYRSGAERADAAAGPPIVVWEYWSGAGWSPLGTHDETNGFAQRGLVTFVAPRDLARSKEFGRPAYWLRARWDRGDYPAPPRLARILTNTMWASHVATVADEILGSSTGEHDQAFAVVHPPVLPGQRIEVYESELPTPGERDALALEEGDDAVPPAGPGGAWLRWHEVIDFAASGSRSRHYVLDRLGGVVRFGDGRHGMAPPAGAGNVRASYRTGGGARGNRPAGALSQLKTAVPYVDAVTNNEPAAGGADAETPAEARDRGPRLLRHGDRSVALADYEDLALEASTEVARVRGVGARSAADAGSVGLVVVPLSSAAQPVPSLELLGLVRSHVAERLSPAVDLWVAGPGWLEVSVRADIAPVSMEAATDVEHAVRLRLAEFLHPLTGGLAGDGWPFGREPHRSDLIAVVESVPGVDHVRSLSVTATLVDPGPAPEAVLVYGADHDIRMTGGREEVAA